MRKIALLIFIFCLLTIASIYFSIPDTIKVSKIVAVNCAQDGAKRFLSQNNNWVKIWADGSYNASSDRMVYDGDTIEIAKRLSNSLQVIFHHHRSWLTGTIEILPLSGDSTIMEWHSDVGSGMNPFVRIARYRQSKRAKRTMSEILLKIKSFLENKENVYGISIEKISTKDTFLVATRSVHTSYPSTSGVYELIHTLRKYIDEQQAQETGNPIMNVTQLDVQKYELMVAVPTNKELPENGRIFFRRMVPGHFMSTEIKGGTFTINQAFNQLQLYMEDYKKTLLAIPFQALITDRSMISDTAKWVTRIYFPTI
jgi:hypothetical protein